MTHATIAWPSWRCLVLASLFLAPFSWAQDFERIQPKTLENTETPPVISYSEPVGEPSGSEEVVGTIKGIALVGHPDEVQADTPPEVAGIEVLSSDLTVPGEVLEALQPYVQTDLSLAAIQSISRDVVLAYRDANLPVVDVGFPEQNVSAGVLQLVIVVGKVGEVNVANNVYFDDKIYLRSFTLDHGDLIWQPSVLKDLRYMSRNPYRQVDLLYTPGGEFGEADIILQAEERRPFSAYVGFENNGNEFIGTDRWNFGVETGNLFGLDHIATYQYTTPIDFEGLHAHSLVYRAPVLATRGEFRFLGGYVETEGDLGAVGPVALTSGGQSVQLTGTYVHPLADWWGIEQDLHLGYDFKSTNNNLEFGGVDVVDTNTEIHQFSLGHSGLKRSKFGTSSFYHRFVWSPGSLSNHNEDDVFEDLRAGASADYFYWSGSFTQIVPLPNDVRFLARANGQLANGNLLPSESSVLGGVGTVRGFEQNITRADEAFIVNAELYSPAMNPLQWLGWGSKTSETVTEGKGGKQIVTKETTSLKDSLRFFGFYDYGLGSNVTLLPGEADSLNLGGVGVGFDYSLESNFSLLTSYGWQVAQSGFEDEETARWHVSATVRW